MGWRAPRQVSFNYNATFYTTKEGNLRWLYQNQGPQGNGLLAFLPTQFHSVEPLDEGIQPNKYDARRLQLFALFGVTAFGLAFVGVLLLLWRRLLLQRGGETSSSTAYKHAFQEAFGQEEKSWLD